MNNDKNLRSITPLPPADFSPEMESYQPLSPFKLWCSHVLPLVYSDTLSYYETLCQLTDYLNVVIENNEATEENVASLKAAYDQLQGYVNSYFSSLDVQEEINNKLDEMAEDGSLLRLLLPTILNIQVPIIVDSTDAMTNHNRLYVLSTTGNIWYYNGTNFVDSGLNYGDSGSGVHSTGVQVRNSNWESALPDANNAPINGIVFVNNSVTSEMTKNLPIYGVRGVLITFAFSKDTIQGASQIYITTSPMGQTYTRANIANTWGNWQGESRVVGTRQNAEMIVTDCNELESNTIYLFGSTNTVINAPYENFRGVIMCVTNRYNNSTGNAQIAIDLNGKLYTRISFASPATWRGWNKYIMTVDSPVIGGISLHSSDDLNNITSNMIYAINSSSSEPANAPTDNFIGNILQLAYENEFENNITQLAVSSQGELYIRAKFGPTPTWRNWKHVLNTDAYIADSPVTGMGTLTATDDLNLVEANHIYLVNANKNTPINAPTSTFIGNIIALAYSYSPTASSGITQIAISSTGKMYVRMSWLSPAEWTDWIEFLSMNNIDNIKAVRSFGVVAQDSSANDLEINSIYIANTFSLNLSDTPFTPFTGVIMTFSFSLNPTAHSGVCQLCYGSNGTMYFRMTWGTEGNWSNWKRVTSNYDAPMIGALTPFRDGVDLNNIPINQVSIINSSSYNIANKPFSTFTGIIITASYTSTPNANSGVLQLAFTGSINEMYSRNTWFSDGRWSNWGKVKFVEEYHVGATREYTSFTQLLYNLKNNTNEKIIYVDGGVYDIFEEYKSITELPQVPVDLQSPSTKFWNYCVRVPSNTHIIGVGNVILQYTPNANETYATQSECLSPLNTAGSCIIENIEVIGKNCRYALHDETLNKSTYYGNTKKYINCKFTHLLDDVGFGFASCVGMGFTQNCNFLFENCYFKNEKTNAAFYCHTQSTPVNMGSNFVFKNCQFDGGSHYAVRMNNTSGANAKNNVGFYNCYFIGDGLSSDENSATTGNYPNTYDITCIGCNAIDYVIRDTNNNYPVKQYNVIK